MQLQSTTSGPILNTPSVAGPSADLTSVPLFLAAWLFAAGITVANWLWLRPSLVLIALALVAALCVLAAFRAQRIAWLPVSVLWLLLGAWCAWLEPHPAPAPALASLSNGLLRSVEGTIVDAGPVRGEIEQNLPNEDPAQAADAEAAPRPAQRIDLRVSTLEIITDTADFQTPVSGNVRLTIRWPASNPAQPAPQPFQCGARFRAVVRLLQPEVYRDPGVWSREDFLLSQGITSTATLNIERVEKVSDASIAESTPGAPSIPHFLWNDWKAASTTLRDPQLLSCRISSLQHAASARILALPAAMRGLPAPLRLTPDDAVMLAAMVTGDRTYLTHSLRVGFERTGSFHMLVVSGFHLAFVAGCIFWLAHRLRMPRVPATFLTILASFAYALFTGFATPVQRSLWMVTLYLLGRLLYRNRSPLNTIGFAALCLLAVSPRSLFDGSFQMTLLAVVAIAGVAAPLLKSTIHPYLTATRDLRLIAIDNKLAPPLAQFRVILRLFASALQRAAGASVAWRIFPASIRFAFRLVELLVVSVVVELAMTLPMALYFHRITLLALPVNLCIFPLLLILMPAALVTLLALLIWPAAAVVPAALVALPLHIGVGLVHLFGSFAFGDARIPAPLLAQSAGFLLLLAASIVFAHRTLVPKKPPGIPSSSNLGSRTSLGPPHIPRFLRNAWGAVRFLLSRIGRILQPRQVAWAALILAAVVVILPRPIDHPHNALLVEAIDVGQGDSILLITPDGKTLLVDGGGFGGGPHQAPQDFDIGEEVVSEVLWSRGIRHLDAVALTHAHSDHMGGLPAVLRNFHPAELWVGHNPRYGPYNALLDEAASLHVRVRAFHAGDALSFGATQVAVLAPFANYQPGPTPTNNDSLVLHMAYGATSVMLEGDAEAPVENAMLAESGLQSTLLKVGHHGSLTSTRPAFLARVAPRWAVVSCGLRNRYGHPRPEVLKELEAAHVRIFSTDLNGAVTFHLDGKTITPH
jgi:competence protein ComEC